MVGKVNRIYLSAVVFLLFASGLVILYFLIYTGAVSNTASQGGSPGIDDKTTYPVPSSDHPRLLVRKEDIPGLKEKIESVEMKDTWKKLLEESSLYTKGDSFDNLRKSFEAYAFLYLVNGDREDGRKAIALAKKAMFQEDFSAYSNMTDYNVSVSAGQLMFGGAKVYDWCYDLLDDKEKKEFIENFERLAGMMEIGYPPKSGSSITGHSSGNSLMRDLIGTGVAIYDEKKEMYDVSVKRFMDEYVPARKFIYQSNMHPQGDSYGQTRYESEIYATWIFDKLGYPRIFGDEQGQVPYRWIYSRRPDGQLLRDGDNFFSGWFGIGRYWIDPRPTMMTYGYFKDPYLKYESDKQRKQIRVYNHDIADPLSELLFSDIKVKSKPVSGLPNTRYFGYPMGSMIARTGWKEGMDSPTVVAEMKIGGFSFNNHAHLDAGHFQIYYKGALAIDSGTYRNYNSSHDLNYQKRTIAHNSLLVYDPDEIFKAGNTIVSNDGGQVWPNGKSEPLNLPELMNKGYRQAKVLNHAFGPDQLKPEYSYLKGDLRGAYSSKVKEMQRSFVFLDLNNSTYPAAMVVFDKIVSAKRDYKKYWLLHAIEEPEISGSTSTIRRTENGYHGKLVLKTLLPEKENLRIEKVGGPGKEFWVFGKNYGPDPYNYSDAVEKGDWRLEVSPKKSSEEELFLNVMYVCDAEREPMPEPVRIDSSLLIGTRIQNRIVLFSKNSMPIKDSMSFHVEAREESLIYLVTGLAEGTWRVEANGKILEQKIRVGKDEGVAYFHCSPGDIKLEPVN